MAGRLAAANASRGGLFLYTSKIPPIGTAVELTIQLPDGSRLALQGTVQHVLTAEQAAESGRARAEGDEHRAESEHEESAQGERGEPLARVRRRRFRAQRLSGDVRDVRRHQRQHAG